jgi:serine protease
LSGTSVTFLWTPSNITTGYFFYVGSTGAGSSNLYNSGNVSVTSATVNDLPNNGQPVYARLYTLINGTWVYNDYTFVAHGSPVEAALTTPTPDTSTPLTGTRVAFAWTPGNLATQYQFLIGNAGVGSSNLYSSGIVTATTETVSGLTANGQTLYVRLSSLLVNGTWQSSDYTYKASGSPTAATLTTPTPNTSTPLSGTSVVFSWEPGNIATNYEFWVGTSAGSSNLYSSGNISATSATVSDLTSNGQKVYARLYSLINGAWKYSDYTYVAYGSPTPAKLTTPNPGSVLAGASVTFSWNPGNAAANFELYLGSTGVGSSNLYNSGSVAVTSETVNGLPVNSEKIYARLYWFVDGAWSYTDYTYTAF